MLYAKSMDFLLLSQVGKEETNIRNGNQIMTKTVTRIRLEKTSINPSKQLHTMIISLL